MKFSNITILLAVVGVFQSDHAFADEGDDIGTPLQTVRFNKFAPLPGSTFQGLPLGPDSYPVSANPEVVQFLQEDSNAISVVNDETDYEIMYSVAELIENVGGLPSHPSSDFDSDYWNKLNTVINMRRKGPKQPAKVKLQNQMQLPLRWKDYTVFEVGEAVHDEYPGLHQAEFMEDLVTGKYGEIEFDYNTIPRRSISQFLRGIVMLADLHTWTVGIVGPHNFSAKWYAGRARPEEIAWLIKTGEVDAPSKISKKINKLKDFFHPQNFTQYTEGSPRHPSWPAMHSAASNVAYWLQIVMNLTPFQLCEAKKVDFAVAFARTVAGVHFEDDNIAGLNMGQEIMARAIPDYFAQKYGSDTSAVQMKVNESRFQWEEYKPLQNCNVFKSGASQ